MKKFNQYTPDYDRPCQMYSQCCGKPLNGDDLENERCPDCREYCTPVEWNDAPTPESEQIKQPYEIINGVFNEINLIFKKAS
jgi:hypothetical protein